MGLKFIGVDDLDIKFDISNVLVQIETIILDWQDLQAVKSLESPCPLCKGGIPGGYIEITL